MVSISQKIIDTWRSYQQEEVASFIINKEQQIDEIKLLQNQSSSKLGVITMGFEVCDGFIHNHISGDDVSDTDRAFMLPNLYYIIITPNKIHCIFNGEPVSCNSY